MIQFLFQRGLHKIVILMLNETRLRIKNEFDRKFQNLNQNLIGASG